MNHPKHSEESKLAIAFLDLGLVVGLGLLIYGLWEVYAPLAPIAGGSAIAVVCGLIGYGRKGTVR